MGCCDHISYSKILLLPKDSRVANPSRSSGALRAETWKGCGQEAGMLAQHVHRDFLAKFHEAKAMFVYADNLAKHLSRAVGRQNGEAVAG